MVLLRICLKTSKNLCDNSLEISNKYSSSYKTITFGNLRTFK